MIIIKDNLKNEFRVIVHVPSFWRILLSKIKDWKFRSFKIKIEIFLFKKYLKDITDTCEGILIYITDIKHSQRYKNRYNFIEPEIQCYYTIFIVAIFFSLILSQRWFFFFFFCSTNKCELRRFRVRFSKKSVEKQYTMEFHRNWKISNLLNI